MKEFQLYIFNFGNTLFDTRDGLELCYQKALGTIGVEYDKGMLNAFMNETLMDTFKRYDDGSSDYNHFAKTFRETSNTVIRDNAKIFDDTVEVIRYLKGEGKNLAIVTTNSADTVADVLKKYKMSDYFDFVIGKDDYQNIPPSSDALNKCLEKYPEMEKGRVGYIVNRRLEMDAADNAGVIPIFVDRDDKEHNENVQPIKTCIRITTLFGLITRCRIFSVGAFAAHYDLLNQNIDLTKVVEKLGISLGLGMELSEKKNNYAKIDVEGGTTLHIFPHGVIVRVCISSDEHHLDVDRMLKNKDGIYSPLTDRCVAGLLPYSLNEVVLSLHPNTKKDKISSHFSNEGMEKRSIVSYHVHSPITTNTHRYFADDVLKLLSQKGHATADSLHAELDKRGVSYGFVDETDVLAAVDESRVLITQQDPEGTLEDYLDFEVQMQNSWFLTHIMNSLVDDIANQDMGDMDLMRETLDTMYTNATFKYVVTSSGQRHHNDMANVLYRASKLGSIAEDFRTKAELLNQKIELNARITESQSSNMMNNILLALTLVSSASAVFQILGYWSINTEEYNLFSLLGSIVIVCAVMVIFLATRHSHRKELASRRKRRSAES